MANPYAVPPDSVYVWRGFKSTTKTYDDFAHFLGNVFVPACALLQPRVGLRAYIPTMIPQANKPASVPDQTALMFWATPQSHNLANGAIAVRIYQNLHGDAYDMTTSHTPEVPQLFVASKKMVPEQPYYLFDNPADWMRGQVRHVVGTRPANVNQGDFINNVSNWARDFQKSAPLRSDAALVVANEEYAAAWAHTPSTSINYDSALKEFSALVQPQLQISPRSTTLGAGLWNLWDGLDFTKEENRSLNLKFRRYRQTNPQPPLSL
jgi:hypothetical protein